jgi:hypothetical protein
VNNDALVGASNASEILTGLYFDISGVSESALSMMSGVATDGLIETGNYAQAADGTAGSDVCAPGEGGSAASPTCSQTVAGGWESGYWPSGRDGYTYGIGTAGLSGAFDSSRKKGTGGLNYGIAPLASTADPALVDPKKGVANATPYVDGTATFVLSGLSSSQITITDVAVNYGTGSHLITATSMSAENDAMANGVPEPATVIQLSGGALMLFAWLRRKRRRMHRGPTASASIG